MYPSIAGAEVWKTTWPKRRELEGLCTFKGLLYCQVFITTKVCRSGLKSHLLRCSLQWFYSLPLEHFTTQTAPFCSCPLLFFFLLSCYSEKLCLKRGWVRAGACWNLVEQTQGKRLAIICFFLFCLCVCVCVCLGDLRWASAAPRWATSWWCRWRWPAWSRGRT